MKKLLLGYEERGREEERRKKEERERGREARGREETHQAWCHLGIPPIDSINKKVFSTMANETSLNNARNGFLAQNNVGVDRQLVNRCMFFFWKSDSNESL